MAFAFISPTKTSFARKKKAYQYVGHDWLLYAFSCYAHKCIANKQYLADDDGYFARTRGLFQGCEYAMHKRKK